MDDKVLKSGLRFELILPTVALVLYEGHLESILDLSGGTAWTWSGAPNWRGKCHQVSSSVHISLLICRVFDYWNINTTTWAIWKHILVGNFVLSHFEMFPYSDRPRNNMCLCRTECRLDTSNISAYWKSTMADVVKCLRHILLGQFQSRGSQWFSLWLCSCCMPLYYGWIDEICVDLCIPAVLVTCFSPFVCPLCSALNALGS